MFAGGEGGTGVQAGVILHLATRALPGAFVLQGHCGCRPVPVISGFSYGRNRMAAAVAPQVATDESIWEIPISSRWENNIRFSEPENLRSSSFRPLHSPVGGIFLLCRLGRGPVGD